jgi:hypothetical protein
MILHKQWIKDELTQEELKLLIHIMQQDSQIDFNDLDVLQCIRLPILSQKMQRIFEQCTPEEKIVYDALKSKLVDFTNLEVQ